LAKEYANSEITLKYLGKTLRIQFNGYGNKIVSATINAATLETPVGVLTLDEKTITDDTVIVVNL
jgi:hypothetical protein